MAAQSSQTIGGVMPRRFRLSVALPHVSARTLFYVLCAFVVAVGVGWNAYYGAQLRPEEMAKDIDVIFIRAGMDATPDFVSTLKWWHGSWVMGDVIPFYRPIPSTLFWLQYRAFGLESTVGWSIVTTTLHLMFLGLLGLLVYRLTGRFSIVALSTTIFAGFRPFVRICETVVLDKTPAAIATFHWKDQPEQLTGILIIGATLLALNKRWAWALVCFVLGVFSKESGWTALAVVPICLAIEGRSWWKRVPKWVWPASFAIGALLLMVRWISLPGAFRGYHFGTNENWATRYVIAAGGRFVLFLLMPDSWPAVLAAVLFVLILWKKGNLWLRTGIGLAAIVIAAFGSASVAGSDPLAAFVGFLDPHVQLVTIMVSGIWLALAWAAIRWYPRLTIGFVSLVLVATASLSAATQVGWHVLYLAYAFQSVLVALALDAAREPVVSFLSTCAERLRTFSLSSVRRPKPRLDGPLHT